MNSIFRSILVCILAMILTACSPDTAKPANPDTATTRAGLNDGFTTPKLFLLSIGAYNYTDRYIDDFRVNGQGGGNLSISNEDHGTGGGSVCCVSWMEGSQLPLKIEIMWTASYCRLPRPGLFIANGVIYEPDAPGTPRIPTGVKAEPYTTREPIVHVAELDFMGPVPKNPKNFVVHFYKDGHIELAMTEEDEGPRLKLPFGDGYARPGSDRTDPPCPPDYDRVRSYRNPIRVDARPKATQGEHP